MMTDSITMHVHTEQSSHCTVSVQMFVQATDKVLAALVINAAVTKSHSKHIISHLALAHMCKEVANAEAV